MTQSLIDAEELEPEMVIALLKEKIADFKRRVASVRIDIQVVESLAGHNPDELATLKKNLETVRVLRDTYQAKLDAIGNTARQALPPPT